jgi:hypothetical protein
MKGRNIVAVIGAAVLLLAVSMPVLANGGSPRDVYALYLVAQRAGDVEGMAEYVVQAKKDQLKAMPEAQKKGIADMMKMMAPIDYTVVTEDIQGDTATVTIKGKVKDFSGQVVEKSGTLRFVKEGGVWKLAREKWKASSR